MQVKKVSLAMAVALILVITNPLGAQEVRGVPVDIPGTGVNFFLYRYEGEEAPYDKIDQIWANLSAAFAQWVDSSQKPQDLEGEDVHIITDQSGSVNIYIKDRFIVEVDQYHAQINKATRQQLAEKWAANLRAGVEKFVAINEVKTM